MTTQLRRCTGMVPALRQTKVAERILAPRAEIRQTDEAVFVEIELPGVSRDQIEVSLHQDELTISATRSEIAGEDGPKPTFVLRERPTGVLRRTFVLGDRLNPDSISAAYADGILTVTIPRAAEAVPRKVAVQ